MPDVDSAELQSLRAENAALKALVAEQNRARELLQERLQALLQAAPLAILVLQPDTTVIEWNRAAEQILGWPASEVLGKPYPSVPEEGREEFARWGDRLLAGEPIIEQMTSRRRRDGSLVEVCLSAAAVRDSQGQITGIMAVMADVTDRRHAERSLRDAEARYRALFEQSPIGIVVIDPETTLPVEFNDAACRQLGYSREEFAQLRIRDIDAGESPAEIQTRVEQIARDGSATFEVRHRTKSGEIRDVSVTSQAIEINGRVLNYALRRDVTERRRLRQELLQAQKMEAVGRLAGGVAHDFNNMLMPILTYGGLLLDKLPVDSPLRHYAEEVTKAAKRAASLPQQLLAFSRKQVLQPQVLDLNTVVADVEKMLRRILGEDITLATSLPPDLDLVLVDPGQVHQVIMNLVVNARDAMPQGGRLLIETRNVGIDAASATLHYEDAPGRWIRLAISDTGCGMDKETQERVFEPFFTTKEQGKGTGLGLSTVFGIVKQSGGHIRVYSELGHGTTFSIYLPAAEDAANAGEVQEKQSAPEVGSETILLVEDEEGVRASVVEALVDRGYRVLVASSGEEALAASAKEPQTIHLMVTDVVMPGMSGRQLAERMASLRPKMKVLFMSGYTDDAIVSHGVLGAGVNFIQKPFAPMSLARKVREVLA